MTEILSLVTESNEKDYLCGASNEGLNPCLSTVVRQNEREIIHQQRPQSEYISLKVRLFLVSKSKM